MALMSRITGAVALGAALLVGAGLSVPSAQAGYVVTLDQVGSDVVASGSGAIDLTGLIFSPVFPLLSHISPGISGTFETGTIIGTSNGNNVNTDFDVPANGPSNFGPGGQALASLSSGDYVEFFFHPNRATANIGFPLGYVSNSPLTSMATFLGQTFTTLGVTPGTYEWTWGTGPNQNFTIRTGAAAMPEPSSLLLLGGALAGLLLVRARRRSPDAG